jgi:hypothetical protein
MLSLSLEIRVGLGTDCQAVSRSDTYSLQNPLLDYLSTPTRRRDSLSTPGDSLGEEAEGGKKEKLYQGTELIALAEQP